VILTMFFLNEEDKCVENLYVVINKRKDGCTFMLEAATRSYILYFFGQGNAIFIWVISVAIMC